MDFGQFMVGMADVLENFGRKDSDKEFFENKAENVISLTDAIANRMSKEDVIQAMLVESVGHSILDSGGVYGRAYQRNREQPHYKYAATTILRGRVSERKVPERGSYLYRPGGWAWRDKSEDEIEAEMERRYLAAVKEAEEHPNDWWLDSFVHHVGKWLEEHTGDVDYDLTERFHAWVWAQDEKDRYGSDTRYTNSTYSVEEWLRDEDEFPDQESVETEGDYCGTVNTYNGEDMLSQTLQYIMFVLDGTPYVGMTIHGGADVRGGYGSVVIFEQASDYSLWDNARGVIYDDTTRAFWDTDDGGYSWHYHEGPQYEVNLATLRSLKIVTRRHLLRAIVSGSRTEPKTWSLKTRSYYDRRIDEPDDWCQRWIERGYLELREVEISPETTKRKATWPNGYKGEIVYVDEPVPAEFGQRLFWNGEPVSEYQYNWWAEQWQRNWFDADLDEHLREDDIRHVSWELRRRVSRFLAGETYDSFNEIYFADDPRSRWEIWWNPRMFWERCLRRTGIGDHWLPNFLRKHPKLYAPGVKHLVTIPKPSYIRLLISNRYHRFLMWARGGDMTQIRYIKSERPLLDEDGVFHSPYWPYDELEGGW